QCLAEHTPSDAIFQHNMRQGWICQTGVPCLQRLLSICARRKSGAEIAVFGIVNTTKWLPQVLAPDIGITRITPKGEVHDVEGQKTAGAGRVPLHVLTTKRPPGCTSQTQTQILQIPPAHRAARTDVRSSLDHRSWRWRMRTVDGISAVRIGRHGKHPRATG